MVGGYLIGRYRGSPADIRKCLCGNEHPEFFGLPFLQLGMRGEAGVGQLQPFPHRTIPRAAAVEREREGVQPPVSQMQLTLNKQPRQRHWDELVISSEDTRHLKMRTPLTHLPGMLRAQALSPSLLGESGPGCHRGRAHHNGVKARTQPAACLESNLGLQDFPGRAHSHSHTS